jgi:hypothetical protein
MKNGNGKEENPITAALADPARTVLTDVGEMGLQELVGAIAGGTEILRKIPFVKWVVAVGNTYSVLQTALFIRRYAHFIGPIRNASDDGWNPEEVEELLGSEKNYQKLIEQTIISLDRYQTELKATLLGKLFVQTFRYRLFSIDEYNTLSFSIELIHPHTGLRILRQFYDCRVAMDAAPSEDERRETWERGSQIDFSPLVHTGLLTLPAGASVVGDPGGAHLNDLGRRFYRHVVQQYETEFGVASEGKECP